MDHTDIARKVFSVNIEALEATSNALTKSFSNAVDAISSTSGHIVIVGIGKSGHIGRKISSTFSSTGTPSFFLHATEALHGDLGMITKDDILILLSYSGKSEELLPVVDYIRRQKNKIIFITGNQDSPLAKKADCVLLIPVKQEASSLPIVPMSSMVAMLSIGDALAAALMEMRGFGESDFSRLHPGGSLGRKMHMTVEQIMVREDLPTVSPSTLFQDIVETSSAGGFGLSAVVEKGEIVGVVSDGDMRRILQKYQDSRFGLQAKDIMTTTPKTISPDSSLAEAEKIMIENNIMTLLVVEDNNRPIGIVQLYEIERTV